MDMQKMMKELQKMQGKMSRIQEEMENTTFEAEMGGVVKVVMNGKFEVQQIKIAKEAVDPDDVEALEDLILATVNAAKAKVDEASQDKMGGITKGLKLPGF